MDNQDDSCIYRLCKEAKEAKTEEEELANEDFWTKERDIPFTADYVTLLAVHGALCLALRHPGFRGMSRPFVVAFTKSLGEYLVHAGALTPELLRDAMEREAREGSSDLEG